MEEQGKVVIDRELLQRMYDLCVRIHRENKLNQVRLLCVRNFQVFRLIRFFLILVLQKMNSLVLFDVILPYMELHKKNKAGEP